ncbi:hypothetical protein [Maridesulfovibrio sp.]|uniref:hypothetical protein n=1 Tax=Maridesulfovibrio sp. TaxID=2795000 RepID=UPI0029CA3C9F|nr:hypothetical protein [Maridesulfovibrio sp.]
MAEDTLHTDEQKQEREDFENAFDAAESADELADESLNEDPQEDSDDSELEAEDGGKGDPQSEDEDLESDEGSASDQILPEEGESGEDPDSSDTEDEESHGSEDADPLAEGRDILDRYFGKQEQPDQAAGDSPALVDVPEDIKAETESILKLNPQYKDILLEDSEQGQRYRSNLLEYGPEAVVGMLESVHQLRQVNPRVEAVISRHEQEARRTHFAEIGKAHPDYAQLIADPEKLGKFNAGFDGWIEGLPYKEAVEAKRVQKSGSASEVSDLLTRYKEATSGTKEDKVDKKAAKDILAVPGKRKAVSGKRGPDEDDFDGGFDAAAAED